MTKGRYLFLAICFMMAISVKAQVLNENFIPNHVKIGSDVSFRAYSFDDKTMLIMTYTNSSQYNLVSPVVIKFKMNDGSIMRFEENPSIHSYSFFNLGGFAVSENKYMVVFPITEEQIEDFKSIGVDRFVINTIPKRYKRAKWSDKESFGKDLYSCFKSLTGDFE